MNLARRVGLRRAARRPLTGYIAPPDESQIHDPAGMGRTLIDDAWALPALGDGHHVSPKAARKEGGHRLGDWVAVGLEIQPKLSKNDHYGFRIPCRTSR